MCDKLITRAASLSSFVSTSELDSADVRVCELDNSHVLVHIVLSCGAGEPRCEIWGDEITAWVVVSCDGERPACCEMLPRAWADTLFYVGVVPIETGL